tara:strand:+ start:14426 stop:15388 length:963 start_codon:yes stop_codon:yes gene_type:complete
MPGMTTPDASIIIPCYNKRDYVAAAIESALAQTHSCEVIVIDDGSTDGSLDVIRTFEDRITLVTGPNRGGCAARNTGMERARGHWLQFLDADDILPAEKIATQVKALLLAPEGSLAACPWHVLHDDGCIDAPATRPYWQSHDEAIGMLLSMWYHGGFLPPHAWLIPRALADGVGPWDTTLAADQDGEFFGRALTLAASVRFCDTTTVLYRKPPPGAVSLDRSRRAAESRMAAYRSVSHGLLKKRDDRETRRACLSRLRKTAYALRDFEDIVAQARQEERRFSTFDFSPSLPPVARVLIGLLGIRRGLELRRLFRFRKREQ